MLLFRFSGSFLFRFDRRTFLGLLFQEPPRNTFRPRSPHERELAKQLLTQLPGIPVLRVTDPRVNSWPDLIPAHLTFSERPLHRPHAPAKADDILPEQASVAGEDSPAEKCHAVRTAIDLALALVNT